MGKEIPEIEIIGMEIPEIEQYRDDLVQLRTKNKLE
jgi:hypothetical protein